jgi:hypothetical protein
MDQKSGRRFLLLVVASLAQILAKISYMMAAELKIQILLPTIIYMKEAEYNGNSANNI